MAELTGTLNKAPTVLWPSYSTIDFFGIEGEYKITGGKAKYIVNIRLRLYADYHMELNVNVPCELKLEYTATGDGSYSVSDTKTASAIPLASIYGTGYGQWTSWDLFTFELPADKQLSQISMNVSLDLYNIQSNAESSYGEYGGPGYESKPGEHFRWLKCSGSNDQLKSITEWEPSGTAPTGLKLSNGNVGDIKKDHDGNTMSASNNSITVDWKVSDMGNPVSAVQWSINGVDWHTVTEFDSTNKGGSVKITKINENGNTHALEAYTLYTVKFKVYNSIGTISDSIQIRTSGNAPSKITLSNGNPGIEAGSNDKSKGITISKNTKSVTVDWEMSSRGTPRCTIEYRINTNDWKTLVNTSDTKTKGSVLINKIIEDNKENNLTPYTAYTIGFRATNIMGTQSETIKIRTAPDTATITEFTCIRNNLESLGFRVKTDIKVAKLEYHESEVAGWVTAANPGDVDLNIISLNGSTNFEFDTVDYLKPDTTHPIKIRVTTTHGVVTTYDSYIREATASPASLSSVGECIFGKPIAVQAKVPGDTDTTSCIVHLIFSDKLEVKSSNITSSKLSYTFNLSQDELDKAYKLYPHSNTNEYDITFSTETTGAKRFGNKVYKTTVTKKYILTGIAKTAHIGVSNGTHRAQCWIGIKNGDKVEVKRAVVWIGTPNGPRRCI